jgi:hypothetical protein
VTVGTVTDYENDDLDCKRTAYTAGMGFIDEGGDHVHQLLITGRPSRAGRFERSGAGKLLAVDAGYYKVESNAGL